MTKIRAFARERYRLIIWLALGIGGLALLLLYKLGSLTGGLSAGEIQTATAAVGWHGIYHQPLYLPLKLLRSAVFFLFPSHGQTLTRFPNAVLGALTVTSFVILIRLWHSSRTALITSLLFATSAWVLHVSRLASFDVAYLWTIPTLLLINILIYRYNDRGLTWYSCLVATGLILYIPGMIWLILINTYFLKKQIHEALSHFKSAWKLGLFASANLLWLPLLILDLTRPGQLMQWLGLPAHLAGPKLLANNFLAVPAHLFIRGPLHPDVWLGHAPILDIFSLVVCVIGIYFYATHLKNARSRLLLSLSVCSWILIGLAGPVGLSLLIPILYVMAATGIAYLLQQWLRVFPMNPFARSFGVALVCAAIILACVYNLRAYFVAWPYNSTTISTFHYRR